MKIALRPLGLAPAQADAEFDVSVQPVEGEVGRGHQQIPAVHEVLALQCMEARGKRPASRMF